MELSNQKKLSEFYEELKRLNIAILRPDINKSHADFFSDGKTFYYALGAIKNVGLEAISNVVEERVKNGEYKNLDDFINRVNPKDINKLQLEGLVQAGAFDNLNNNRNSMLNSIPNIILKSKNIHENKSINQIDLFSKDEIKDNFYIEKKDEWSTDIKLNKEFETLGFYISDHPLNQYKSLFSQYNIISYDDFEYNTDKISSNIACTVLKVQEKKTQKGNSYGIIKFSDLSNVFELFIFSDIFEANRGILIEGNSLMITLMKSYADGKNQKRINVKKIISLSEVMEKPIKNLTLKFNNINELKILSNLSKDDGETDIKILLDINENLLTFLLKDKRKVNNKLINSLNLEENIIID